MEQTKIGNQPVTWDMIAGKLDAELEHMKTLVPEPGTEHLMAYLTVAAHYIHRHLKNAQVPAEMYDAVYRREKILGLVSHHWLDEAKRRGGDTRDKAAVAAISVQNWLEEVRGEEAVALGSTAQPRTEAVPQDFAANFENDEMDDDLEL